MTSGAVNWSAYTEEQLRELELLPLASWSQAVPASSTGASQREPRASAVPTPTQPIETRTPAPEPSPVVAKVASPDAPQTGRALGTADWSALREQVSACRACNLCKMRKQAVFGTGVESGPWLFVGEGPGMEEDQAGEPFVGQAGKLLDAMLASIQLSRKTNVYIANVVKCRPPGNRNPLHDEVAACADFLDRQIDLVSPRLIVALGKTAATRLTGREASLASQRGKDFTYRGYPLLVTYHPAYLLRNLPDKAMAWEDLLRAKRIFAERG